MYNKLGDWTHISFSNKFGGGLAGPGQLYSPWEPRSSNRPFDAYAWTEKGIWKLPGSDYSGMWCSPNAIWLTDVKGKLYVLQDVEQKLAAVSRDKPEIDADGNWEPKVLPEAFTDAQGRRFDSITSFNLPQGRSAKIMDVGSDHAMIIANDG